MKIQVTQEDIKKATEHKRMRFLGGVQYCAAHHCPVSQAIKRMYPGLKEVKSRYAIVGIRDEKRWVKYRTSKRMVQFMHKFDCFKDVNEQTFILKDIVGFRKAQEV